MNKTKHPYAAELCALLNGEVIQGSLDSGNIWANMYLGENLMVFYENSDSGVKKEIYLC